METTYFIQDFEMASLNTIRVIFPDKNYGGCFFHFRQSLHRNLVSKELGVKYRKYTFLESWLLLIESLGEDLD